MSCCNKEWGQYIIKWCLPSWDTVYQIVSYKLLDPEFRRYEYTSDFITFTTTPPLGLVLWCDWWAPSTIRLVEWEVWCDQWQNIVPFYLVEADWAPSASVSFWMNPVSNTTVIPSWNQTPWSCSIASQIWTIINLDCQWSQAEVLVDQRVAIVGSENPIETVVKDTCVPILSAPTQFVWDNGWFIWTGQYDKYGNIADTLVTSWYIPTTPQTIWYSEKWFSFTATTENWISLDSFIAMNSAWLYNNKRVLSISIFVEDELNDLTYTSYPWFTPTVLKKKSSRAITFWEWQWYPIQDEFFYNLQFQSNTLVTVAWEQVHF